MRGVGAVLLVVGAAWLGFATAAQAAPRYAAPAGTGKAKCALLRPVTGTLAETGAPGSNSFRFSGRLGGKPLKPGSYVLVGSAGGATKEASFKILR